EVATDGDRELVLHLRRERLPQLDQRPHDVGDLGEHVDLLGTELDVQRRSDAQQVAVLVRQLRPDLKALQRRLRLGEAEPHPGHGWPVVVRPGDFALLLALGRLYLLACHLISSRVSAHPRRHAWSGSRTLMRGGGGRGTALTAPGSRPVSPGPRARPAPRRECTPRPGITSTTGSPTPGPPPDSGASTTGVHGAVVPRPRPRPQRRNDRPAAAGVALTSRWRGR